MTVWQTCCALAGANDDQSRLRLRRALRFFALARRPRFSARVDSFRLKMVATQFSVSDPTEAYCRRVLHEVADRLRDGQYLKSDEPPPRSGR